ncbi:MAG: GTP 3',8-cyclase MoaA [Methanospirillaceae archaeon]|nr:GTP 3',8-cyclase MoaA [Methanospirillaceae archaeon]
MVLYDPYNRPVTNLRISLCKSCNLACIYCHREGEQDPSEMMSADTIDEIIQTGIRFGIKSIKFTGGEPLLRPDLVDIISRVPPGIETSITTNGILLASMASDLSAAGLSRVNISIDSLNHETYAKITGRDYLFLALEGIDAALTAGLAPVKINMVLLAGINENDVDAFIAYVSGKRGLILQVIELMESGDCPYHADVSRLESRIARDTTEIMTRKMHHRKKYCFHGAQIEFVRPVHNSEFCMHCNRLRVTSDGKLKPCLLRNDNLIDINGLHGKDLDEAFIKAVGLRKPYYR